VLPVYLIRAPILDSMVEKALKAVSLVEMIITLSFMAVGCDNSELKR